MGPPRNFGAVGLLEKDNLSPTLCDKASKVRDFKVGRASTKTIDIEGEKGKGVEPEGRSRESCSGIH